METKIEHIKNAKDSDYVSFAPLKKKKCQYNILLGERSNGKSTAVLDEILSDCARNNHFAIYLRRRDEDLKSKRVATMYSAIVKRGLVEKYTKGKYNDIKYYNSAWYLATSYIDEKGNNVTEKADKPFMRAFSLTASEHDKGFTLPDVYHIFFDEFFTRFGYLADEYVTFSHALSTFIREKDISTIYMCGNTMNGGYCPYFKEMGLTEIKKMKRGDIDVYKYGNTGLRVGVFMTDSLPSKIKKSNVYFAFGNPKLSMITGDGDVWEMDLFPHCPIKYQPKHVRYSFFMIFDNITYQADLICKETHLFIFIHDKTTPIKYPDKDLTYTSEYKSGLNYRQTIFKPISQIEKTILLLFLQNKVFYQDNEVGNAIKNFLLEMKKN